METKPKRGGARPGAGRPTTNNTARLCVRIPSDVAEMFDVLTDPNGGAHTNRSAYVAQLIRDAYAQYLANIPDDGRRHRVTAATLLD